ncbi:MAG: AMP-binding protein [Rubrivivax sp.]
MRMNFARSLRPLAVRYADREALVNIERGRRYNYRELQALTNRIVNMMRERLALRRGDAYLCILENDNLSLLHVWTALKGEAAVAYTNLRDSIEEHRWQVEFIKPKVVFIENALLDRYFDLLRERGATVVCMDPPAEPREDCTTSSTCSKASTTPSPRSASPRPMSWSTASPAAPRARASARSTRSTTGWRCRRAVCAGRSDLPRRHARASSGADQPGSGSACCRTSSAAAAR